MISLPSTVSTDISTATISFDAIPLWKGVQKVPGIWQNVPFALTASGGGLIRQVTDKKIIDEVVQAYQSDKYNFITTPPGASEWANSLGELSVTAVTSAVGSGSPRSILEIGAGSTYVASRLRQQYRPDSYVIVDPSIREITNEVEIIREYFPNSQLGERRFDLILAFNTLEHVPDPLAFLHGIRTRLLPQGQVILLYPDCEQQLQRGDLNVLLHEHLSYFTEASSRQLAATAGFDIQSLKSEQDTFFTVLTAGLEVPEIDPLVESELLLQSAVAFNNVLTGIAAKILKHLDRGEHVGFHGATNGLNTFLFMTGLAAHPNIRLYDGDTSKEGRYLPALYTPIRSPHDRSYAENHLMVISAMSYFDPIVRFAVEKAGLDRSLILPLMAA